MELTLRPMSDVLGAVVVGLGLSRPPDNATLAFGHRAFLDHLVLVFREETLSTESQLAFLGRSIFIPRTARRTKTIRKSCWSRPESGTASMSAFRIWDRCGTPISRIRTVPHLGRCSMRSKCRISAGTLASQICTNLMRGCPNAAGHTSRHPDLSGNRPQVGLRQPPAYDRCRGE